MRLFTSPAARYSQLIFNQSESGAAALRQLEVRQALAYGLDRERLVDEAVNGQGIPLEGPYLPSSWASNPASVTAYPYDPGRAAALLEEAGWSRPADGELRQSGGVTLTLRLVFPNGAGRLAIAETVADDWAALGVGTEMVLSGPDSFPEALGARLFDVALVEVEAPGDPDLYDFWSQEAIVRGHNYGGWNNRRASEALEAGRQLWLVDERRPYYDAFLRFFSADLPALTLYQHVTNYGLSESVREADIGRYFQPRDRYTNLASWFFLFREVSVACPATPEAASG
jgi:peptide/nickel transport system substrate-binding protein